ncbi:MAG: hypothetical protein ACFWUL_09555 [Dialister sp.]
MPVTIPLNSWEIAETVQKPPIVSKRYRFKIAYKGLSRLAMIKLHGPVSANPL